MSARWRQGGGRVAFIVAPCRQAFGGKGLPFMACRQGDGGVGLPENDVL